MSLILQLTLLIAFLVVAAISGTNSKQQKIDREINEQLKNEADKRILNSRIRKERGINP